MCKRLRPNLFLLFELLPFEHCNCLTFVTLSRVFTRNIKIVVLLPFEHHEYIILQYIHDCEYNAT